MNEFIELTEEEWFDTFKPIPNHIDNNASFQTGEGVGYMFETYGKELEFVKAQAPNTIWTYGDGDNGSYIWSGWHFVNRIGYFISTVPFDENKDYQIEITTNDIYVCPNCDEEWEDEDAIFHYDKFEDLEKCAKCATVEELKELEEMEGQDLNG